MDIEFDILCDLVAEGYAPVSEITFFTSPAVKRVIKEVPLITKKEFTNAMEPGDIVVAFSAKKQFVRTKHAKFMAKLMATAQGTPYTSSKLVVDKGHVAGYGIQIIDKPEKLDEIFNKFNHDNDISKIIFIINSTLRYI